MYESQNTRSALAALVTSRREIIALNAAVQSIVQADLPWKDKYMMVFELYYGSGITIDWFDPDGDYQDDVVAFAGDLEKESNAAAAQLRALENADSEIRKANR